MKSRNSHKYKGPLKFFLSGIFAVLALQLTALFADEHEGNYYLDPDKQGVYEIRCKTFNSPTAGGSTVMTSHSFLISSEFVPQSIFCGSREECLSVPDFQKDLIHCPLNRKTNYCTYYPVIVAQYCAEGPENKAENRVTVRVGIVFDYTELTVSHKRGNREQQLDTAKLSWATSQFVTSGDPSNPLARSSTTASIDLTDITPNSNATTQCQAEFLRDDKGLYAEELYEMFPEGYSAPPVRYGEFIDLCKYN